MAAPPLAARSPTARISASVADLNEISLLRDDDCLLRQTFLDILKHHHPSLGPKLDAIYAFSDAWCTGGAGAGSGGGGSDADFKALEAALAKLTPEEMIL